MLKDFVLNAALLLSSFSVMGQIFKNKPLKTSSPLSTKLYWGLCYGILGNVLMLFSIKVNPTTLADLRHLAIVIPAAFGGFIPALTAAALIALGRLLLFSFNPSVILPICSIFLTSIVCGFISNLKLKAMQKAFLMNLAALLIFSIVFILKINDSNILRNLLILHIGISLIGGLIAYHFAVYLNNSSEAQRQLKTSVIKLKETEERFRLLAEYSSDLITMHNAQSEYIYISPAVNEILKYEYPELLGRRMAEFIHSDDIKTMENIFHKALNEGSADAVYRYRTKLGDYMWIESTLKSFPFQEGGARRVIIVSRNITERKLTEQKMQEANQLLNRLSYMDGLTGIANRRYFDETIKREWESSDILTLLMFDIDYFKKYNDTYGHVAGDHCLQAIAQAIHSKVIKNTGYTFCRYGGEEFAIILPSEKLEDGLKTAALIQKAIQALKIPHASSEVSDIVTLSIGLASLRPKSGMKEQDLIHKADSALYKSKTTGRNKVTAG